MERQIASHYYERYILGGLDDAVNIIHHMLIFVFSEDRNTIKSCIIISQLPISNWYDIFFDPTLAEAIMDRIQSNSYKIELKGPSKRGTLYNDIE